MPQNRIEQRTLKGYLFARGGRDPENVSTVRFTPSLFQADGLACLSGMSIANVK
jgi:hypothetical protein